MRRVLSVVLLLASVMLFSSVGSAQPTTDARDYEGSYFLPDHSRTFLFWNYLRHQTTSTVRNVTTNSDSFRATYVLKFGNLAITPFDALLSVADADLKLYTNPAAPQFGPSSSRPIGPVATGSSRNTGFTDLQFLPSVTYHITQKAEDFTHSYVGGNLYVTAPIGNYSSKNLVNIGENRWTLKPQIAVGQRFLKAFTVDVVANAVIYMDNDNFAVRGAAGTTIQTMKQKTSYNAELHLGMDIHPTMYVSASYYLAKIGKRYTDLVPEVEEKATVHTMRFNWGVHIEKQTLLLLQLQQDLKAVDAPNARFMGLRISHYFF